MRLDFSKDTGDSTAIGMILQDTHERIAHFPLRTYGDPVKREYPKPLPVSEMTPLDTQGNEDQQQLPKDNRWRLKKRRKRRSRRKYME